MSMTITDVIKRPRFYDGKVLWEVYHSWGRAASHGRLRDWALENGMSNPYSGRVSQMGAYFAMWRYAVNNPEEAYPHYERWAREYTTELASNGIEINFNTFLRDVKKHAKRAVGETAYQKFVEKYAEELKA